MFGSVVGKTIVVRQTWGPPVNWSSVMGRRMGLRKKLYCLLYWVENELIGLGRCGMNWQQIHSVQFNSVTQSCRTLHNPMDYSIPGFPIHHQLPEFTQIHVHWVSDAIQPSYPLLLPPSVFPSITIFSDESVLHIKWPKYWSFSFSISPSNEYSGLISFRMDWMDLIVVQGTLKSLLQHHSSK